MNDWDGKDRRAPEGILLAVMNHVQETLDRHTEMMDKKFGHLNDRVDNLITSINSYMDKHSKLEKAFLEDHHGHPDLDGHRNDHFYRKEMALWWGKVKTSAFVKLVEWGTVAAVAWIAYALWAAFVKEIK